MSGKRSALSLLEVMLALAILGGSLAVISQLYAIGARQAIATTAAELAAIPPFSQLAPVDRARLAAALEELHAAPGEVIFEQGSPPDALYILRTGLVERSADGTRLDILHPPAVFGDLALLRDEPRATTLAAVTECVIWRLPADRFMRLLHRTPALATFFAAAVSTRLATRRFLIRGAAAFNGPQ